jgi:hypothetical protein
VDQDPVAPVLGLMAAGGIGGADLGARVVVAAVVGTFLLDTLAPILRLPDWVEQLALTTHLGEPMVGRPDAACVAIGVAGLLIGAWGMGHRDVGG